MKRKLGIVAYLLCVLVAVFTPLSFSASTPEHIDVAIALDTSDSMEQLIDTTRLKLWEIVNDLVVLEPAPTLRVALISYGNNKYPPAAGWVRVETPLTTDLDLVSERLFDLEVSGGNEYVARVIKTALEELEWSEDSNATRLLIVAGNEAADQDKQFDHRDLGIETSREEVVLHVIYCGGEKDTGSQSWKELAEFAGGQFATIDHRTKAQLIETPFDKELAELGSSLNRTFVPIGKAGNEGLEVQAAQDQNVEALGLAAAATRAETKASALYARDWDLLDAVSAGRVDLYEISAEELPEAMREMSPAERETYVEEILLERETLQQRILQLGAKRREHVAQMAKKKGLDDTRTFDGVIRHAIREQMESQGFTTGGSEEAQ